MKVRITAVRRSRQACPDGFHPRVGDAGGLHARVCRDAGEGARCAGYIAVALYLVMRVHEQAMAQRGFDSTGHPSGGCFGVGAWLQEGAQ